MAITIDEAVEELERGTRQNRSTNNKRLRKALGLGAEALKREKRYRFMHPLHNEGMLPGETEE